MIIYGQGVGDDDGKRNTMSSMMKGGTFSPPAVMRISLILGKLMIDKCLVHLYFGLSEKNLVPAHQLWITWLFANSIKIQSMSSFSSMITNAPARDSIEALRINSAHITRVMPT